MTLPKGKPPWEGTSEAANYGGHPLKRNYQAQGPVNPKTDLDVSELQRMAVDMAAVARTASFCSLTLVCNDTGSAAPTVQTIRQMNRISEAGYEGDTPSHASFPTITRVSAGKVKAIWPTTQADEYGVEADLDLGCLSADVIGSASFAKVVIEPISATEIDFTAVDKDGAVISDARMSIEVS